MSFFNSYTTNLHNHGASVTKTVVTVVIAGTSVDVDVDIADEDAARSSTGKIFPSGPLGFLFQPVENNFPSSKRGNGCASVLNTT